jgi:uncharacterized DUF497 family protein
MRISYDPAKRERTLEERGLDFEDAPELFAGFHLTAPDLRRDYGEARWISLGAVGETVVALVWTEREGGGRRIISMRKADRDERGDYAGQRDRSG